MPAGRDSDALDAAVRAASADGDRLSPARLRLRAQSIAIARSEQLVASSWSWRVVDLDAPAGEVLQAGGETLLAPRLVPETGRLTALACAVCTIGSALEQRVRALFDERRPALAVALDELGNEALFAASRRLQDRLLAAVLRSGRTMAGELRPGDPGLEASAQASVLHLAAAHECGCRVTPGGLLDPMKSTSMVFGVGIDLPAANWSRCDPCPSRDRCRIGARRAAARMDTLTTQ